MVRTYITLFSCAGVGCYGFKMNGFECVATNELLEQRLSVQKANSKCKYPSGYICGDATSPETHQLILNEISMWKEKEGMDQVDVVFATPPCQGMSTANYKKNDHEQIRNSLVVEAIKMIKQIHPKIFVFENVRAFMKSVCTDISGDDMLIKDCIFKNLSDSYLIDWKIINFKDYGVPSSRPRTLVIGTSKELKNVTPLHLFPRRRDEIPLRESIGKYARLNYCEKDKNDPFHFARPFPEYMLDWIKDLKEGETAFNNPDDKKPYSIDIDGNKVINKGAYMGNKYRRLIWDRPGACIATRSDIMSSQDTIHPCDNRVLSIRELMTLMTIPDSFKWTDYDDELTVKNSDDYLKENEGNIRRCIGEAVPTHIGYTIAKNIKTMLDYEDFVEECCRHNDPIGFAKSKEESSIDKRNETNLYKKLFRLGYTDLEAVNVFNQILEERIECDNLSISVDSDEDFFKFIPQLCSYCSNAKKLSVYRTVKEMVEDVLSLDESLIHEFDLGSNCHILEEEKDGHVRIDVHANFDICIQEGRLEYIKTSGPKQKKNEDSVNVQLTLDFGE